MRIAAVVALCLWCVSGCRAAPEDRPQERGEEPPVAVGSFHRLVDDLPARRRVQASQGGETREVLAEAAVSAGGLPRSPELYRSPLLVMPAEGRLSVAVAVLASRRAREKLPVTFRVELEAAGEGHELFARTVDTQDPAVTGGWVDHEIDLEPFAGSEARLVFRIEAPQRLPDGVAPVWGGPVVWREEAPPDPSRPNVILVSLDTLRADHLGCYGYPRDTSPNIDRFASRALVFENAIAPSSWTLPSHASLFTGLHPAVHGATHEKSALPPDAMTLALVARSRGYRTAAFTGGGFVSASWGFARGFERYVERDEPEENLAHGLELLRGAAGAPFFVFFHTYRIHAPYAPPEAYAARFVDPDHRGEVKDVFRATPPHAEIPRQHYVELVQGLSAPDRQRVIDLYDGEIAYTDALLGDFLARLEREAAWRNTLVVILSDHGEELWDHGRYGHGISLYDEQLRVPLIVKLPGADPPRGRIRDQVALVDLYATVAEILGTEAPARSGSASLLPLAGAGERGVYERRYVLSEVGFVADSWQTIPERPVQRSIRSPVAKLVESPDGVELYRLAEDPLETENLYAVRSAEAMRYAAALEAAHERFAALRLSLEKGAPDLSAETRERLEALGYL